MSSTDDIVTRLRDDWCSCNEIEREDCPEPIMSLAAYEIERLRAELARTQNDLRRIEMKHIRELRRGHR